MKATVIDIITIKANMDTQAFTIGFINFAKINITNIATITTNKSFIPITPQILNKSIHMFPILVMEFLFLYKFYDVN